MPANLVFSAVVNHVEISYIAAISYLFSYDSNQILSCCSHMWFALQEEIQSLK